MKNKLLSYLLGGALVIFMGFITSCVYAQVDDKLKECYTNCPTDNINEYSKCITKCITQHQQQQQTKEECKDEDGCCGIKLNTKFPGIGDCITYKKGKSNPTEVFQKMMGSLTKLVTSIILVVCFITIIIAGIIWAGAGEDSSQRTKAKKLIEKVAITILLLGFSGVILKLINPNFFG